MPGGRCETCEGDGFQKLEMYFVEDVYVTCQECEGRRYRADVLQVTYKSRDISQVLQQTVDEAVDFFAAEPVLAAAAEGAAGGRPRLPAAGPARHQAVGRRGAAARRSRRSCPRAPTTDHLFILDEPTTGLHLDDVRKLLLVLNRLVEAGNTVLVVEHHLDVIKTADWVVDLGPEAGAAGGELVAEGTPEQIAQVGASYTGKFLRELLPRPTGRAAAGRS